MPVRFQIHLQKFSHLATASVQRIFSEAKPPIKRLANCIFWLVASASFWHFVFSAVANSKSAVSLLSCSSKDYQCNHTQHSQIRNKIEWGEAGRKILETCKRVLWNPRKYWLKFVIIICEEMNKSHFTKEMGDMRNLEQTSFRCCQRDCIPALIITGLIWLRYWPPLYVWLLLVYLEPERGPHSLVPTLFVSVRRRNTLRKI